MAIGCQKIGRKFLEYLQKKDIREPHQRLPHLSGVRKENGERFRTTFTSIHTPKSQSHHAVGSPPPAIFPILPFAFFTTSLS
jgi:hypothetical protein